MGVTGWEGTFRKTCEEVLRGILQYISLLQQQQRSVKRQYPTDYGHFRSSYV